jgi:hypothetical protein
VRSGYCVLGWIPMLECSGLSVVRGGGGFMTGGSLRGY